MTNSTLNTKEQRYEAKTIEDKWKSAWKHVALDVASMSSAKKPFYNLMMFPYPSAEGLHVGNMYAFTGSDIYGRFKRMQGFDVFEPIGLDGFGIHSENYAFKVGRHPMDHARITQRNFYDQLQRIGAMYDWTRTVETYDPEYYRWTQWLFVQMFKHNLAYRRQAQVNWCPSCKTVLADEQVIDGLCERCGNKIVKRQLEQWFFRITAYAEKLLENLSSLDWSAKVKLAQQQWIGKKEGINITYPVLDEKQHRVGDVVCFTTRPDTNFGAIFVVISPEHPLVESLKKYMPSGASEEIRHYVARAKSKSEMEPIAEGKKKTGVFTGLFVLNQLNDYKMPLYISDFVLMDVGTGAVVGVPGHDKRDFEFAQSIKLPIIRVVKDQNGDISAIASIEQVQEEDGIMINSQFLNGLEVHAAIGEMIDYLEHKGWGKRVLTYHLRDWLVSRQRYWGAPIPMIFCNACKTAKKGERADMPGWWTVLLDDLPVVLPRIEDYKPGDDGIAPLAKHKEFYETTCPGCGGKAVRETDVSDTFLDSSWYFLKYPSVGSGSAGPAARVSRDSLQFVHEMKSITPLPSISFRSEDSSQEALTRVTRTDGSGASSASSDPLPWNPEITKTWLPVDMYTGGAEHSVLHLMYARFVTMALHDFGYLDFEEPFPHFYAHGLIIKDGAKMSKSKGNVVNPDQYIDLYGADSLRLYLMFTGPFSQGGDFRDSAMEGMSRWVGRIWRIAQKSLADPNLSNLSDLNKVEIRLNKLINKVADDIEKRRFNTAIASMMEFTNFVQDEGGAMTIDLLKKFILVLSPFAPFLTEELWQQVHGRTGDTFKISDSIHVQPWPQVKKSFLKDETATVIIQVNGRLRDKLDVPVEVAQDQKKVEQLALARPKVQAYVGNKASKTIFVPGKLINFVVSS